MGALDNADIPMAFLVLYVQRRLKDRESLQQIDSQCASAITNQGMTAFALHGPFTLSPRMRGWLASLGLTKTLERLEAI